MENGVCVCDMGCLCFSFVVVAFFFLRGKKGSRWQRQNTEILLDPTKPEEIFQWNEKNPKHTPFLGEQHSILFTFSLASSFSLFSVPLYIKKPHKPQIALHWKFSERLFSTQNSYSCLLCIPSPKSFKKNVMSIVLLSSHASPLHKTMLVPIFPSVSDFL